MRYFEHMEQNGPWHMAFDSVMLDRVDQGSSEAFFRLYTWTPWCITLGSFQVADEQLDPQRVTHAGYDIAPRITGGRAVFHAQEITYTLCARKDIAPWGKTLGLTYDWIGERILEALSQVGFTGSLERGDYQTQDNQATRALAKPPCFTSASRAEIVWQGRKVVGSAQRRSRHAFLQHGSILLGPAHADLVNFLAFPQEQKKHLRADLLSHSACLAEMPQVNASLPHVKQVLYQTFQKALDLTLPQNPTAQELQAVNDHLLKNLKII